MDAFSRPTPNLASHRCVLLFSPCVFCILPGGGNPEVAAERYQGAYLDSQLHQYNVEEINRLSVEQPHNPQIQSSGDFPGMEGKDLGNYANSLWTQTMLLQLRLSRGLYRDISFTLSR